MESMRQNKVARLLQKELATYFQAESRTLFQGKMITVTQVRVSADLSLAKIYVSIFPYLETENYLSFITEHTKIIRSSLSQKIRHQVRVIPELVFFRDDSIEYADRIDRLLKK